ncbi:MAG TPA: ComF family protein [Polyangiaceae bacterium]
MSFWRGAVACLLDALAPPGCLACDAACDAPLLFCRSCGEPARRAEQLTLTATRLELVGPYRPPLSTAIVRFKYQGRPELSRPLSTLLFPAIHALALPDDAALVPVPMHPRRLAERGYNQAALLAQALSREARRSCRPRLLRRVRETERQVGKSRAERRDNMRDLFELDLRQRRPARVVLVDDVITTGSTVRACAQALAAGGVELTAIVALARAEPG